MTHQYLLPALVLLLSAPIARAVEPSELKPGLVAAYLDVPRRDPGRGVVRLEPTVGVAPPSAEEFRICIDWFYAAAIQYAKAVVRGDPWPIKTRDADLKERLLQMIEWDHGVRNGWAEQPPHNGSRISEWAAPELVTDIAACWSDFSIEWSEEALGNSIALFDRLAARVAAALGFRDEVTARASAEVDRILAKRLEP